LESSFVLEHHALESSCVLEYYALESSFALESNALESSFVLESFALGDRGRMTYIASACSHTKVATRAKLAAWVSTIELWVCLVLCLRAMKRENNEGGEWESNACDQVKCSRHRNDLLMTLTLTMNWFFAT